MSNRISSAYQQFSSQIARQNQTRPVESPSTVQKSTASGETTKSQTQQSRGLSREQRMQLVQLRNSGTLDNLQAILSQDEETLLQKLFGGNSGSYNIRAEKESSNQAYFTPKGELFDSRM